MMPFLLEDPEDEAVEHILWGTPAPAAAAPEAADSRDQQDGKDDGEQPNGDSPPVEAEAPAAPAGSEVALARQILHHIMRFLFLPDFTIERRHDKSLSEVNQVDPSVVWRYGIGVPTEQPGGAGPTELQYRARTEVLRCLLTCLSGPLFQATPAEEQGYQELPSRWLLHFTGGEVCHTANLFCSLMSTVFLYDPVGWGVPYSGW